MEHIEQLSDVAECANTLVEQTRTATHEFSTYANEVAVFSVLPGVPLEEALIYACEYLKGGMAANIELVEAVLMSLRPLGGTVGHSIGMALALVEASIKGLEAAVRSSAARSGT